MTLPGQQSSNANNPLMLHTHPYSHLQQQPPPQQTYAVAPDHYIRTLTELNAICNAQITLKDGEINEKNIQIRALYDQLKEKDVHIRAQNDQIKYLQETIEKLKLEKSNQLIPRKEDTPKIQKPKTQKARKENTPRNQNSRTQNTRKEDTPKIQKSRTQNAPFIRNSAPKPAPYAASVVITNIDEEIIIDDEMNGEITVDDETKVKHLISNIDSSVTIVSVSRMGEQEQGKNRPLKVVFKNKNERHLVLTKAPAYIKKNDEYKSKNVFVNKMVSREAHLIQVELSRKRKNLYNARENNSTTAYFINKNQIYEINKAVVNGQPKLVECDENIKAADFYKINHSFRLQTPEQQQQPIYNNENAMDVTTAKQL